MKDNRKFPHISNSDGNLAQLLSIHRFGQYFAKVTLQDENDKTLYCRQPTKITKQFNS